MALLTADTYKSRCTINCQCKFRFIQTQCTYLTQDLLIVWLSVCTIVHRTVVTNLPKLILRQNKILN